MTNYQSRPRIGGVTFHRAINYGAVLQAYALQKTIEKLGYQYNIIDYRSSVMESRYKEMELSDCRTLKSLVRYIVYSKKYNDKIRKFRKFTSDFLNLSDTCNNISELRNVTSKYDMFICGSDQVWNYKITEFDRAYFLDFVEENIKKSSYAASFGLKGIPSDYIYDFQQMLKNFNYISVREKEGARIIKELTGRDVEVVLDPTMLIPKEEWNIIAKEYNANDDYILVYAFGSSDFKGFVEKLSRQTGCKVVCISHSLVKKYEATYERCVGPTEFLGLFYKAKYIVTNSFHGTAFSIIFNKNFFVEWLSVSEGVNSRLENILDVFDLNSRRIINGENVNVNESINYEKVNQILGKERKKSIDFLKRILESSEVNCKVN